MAPGSVLNSQYQRRSWCGQFWLACCVVIFLTLNTAVSTQECPLYVNEAGVNVQNCSGKDLRELSASQLSDQAEILDFSRNKFTTLPILTESKLCPDKPKCPRANSTYHCRRDISFSRNQINNLTEDSLRAVSCLETLDLSFNELTADVFHANTFQSGVFYLHRLLLNNNPLGRLPGSVITQPFLPHLHELDLSHCDLEELAVNGVDDFGELQMLNLSFNKLKALDGATFKGLSKLEHLDLRENQLTYLSEDIFADEVSLKVLLLSDNKIQGFHDKAFDSNSILQVLDLRGNQLTSVPYRALEKLTKLQSLDLSENPIQQVNRGPVVSSLQKLALDNLPDLAELGPYSLASFTGLVSLSISDNTALEVIHPQFLGHKLASLKHIRLENNKLSTLSSETIPWQQLAVLKVAGNPWYCDNELEWMLKAYSIQNDAQCAGPLPLKGEKIKNLKPNDLMRDFALQSVTAIVILSLCLPLLGVCAVLIWRRRRYCPCVKVTIKGQYVTLFTREIDEERDQRVDVELKVNGSKLSAISNGTADDTEPFIRLHKGSERLVDI